MQTTVKMLRQVFIRWANGNRLNNVLTKCSSDFHHNKFVINETRRLASKSHANMAERKRKSSISENEFLIKIKDDPDNFGSGLTVSKEEFVDDIKEEEFLKEKPVRSQKLSTKQYADIIKSHIRKRKIKEAIDVVEIRMLKEDRVKPENYIFNLIIGACGRVGYTKKAFSLYNEMKKRDLQVTPGTYTALFNACANSPWPTTDGLTRAKSLRNIMIEKGYEPNITNYNAMIKAFGWGGDLITAFTLVDEMSAKQIAIKDDTLNFLLQACISDKEAGFRHALLVWRKLIEKRISPSLYTYNLLLRCARDCGLGDMETTNAVINQILPKHNQQLLAETDQKLLVADTNSDQFLKNIEFLNKPNLMANVPCLGNILSLTEVKKPEDRLLLLGGCSAFLQNMIDNKCTPDIKTFTQMLDNIPSTLAAEIDLLQALKNTSVKPDIDFYNMLMKKRSMRFDYESGKEVLQMVKKAKFRPNLITYGILSLGCQTKSDACSLLDEMSEDRYRINIEILGAMLTQACYHTNFQYVLYLMQLCIDENIKPSEKFINNLKEFRKKCKQISADSNNPTSKSRSFISKHKTFREEYKTWQEKVQLEETVHPWQQYRQTSATNVKHYKDKEATSRFKPVHLSLFKKKTSIKNITRNKR